MFKSAIIESWFDHINEEIKKIEICKVSDFKNMKRGDEIVFETKSGEIQKSLTVKIKAYRSYTSVFHLLVSEGIRNILPGGLSIEQALNIYRKKYGDEMNDVMALELELTQKYVAPVAVLEEKDYKFSKGDKITWKSQHAGIVMEGSVKLDLVTLGDVTQTATNGLSFTLSQGTKLTLHTKNKTEIGDCINYDLSSTMVGNIGAILSDTICSGITRKWNSATVRCKVVGTSKIYRIRAQYAKDKPSIDELDNLTEAGEIYTGAKEEDLVLRL